MKFEKFIGPSYSLRNVSYDCQRTVNWYAEVDESGGGREAEVAQFIPRPGLRTVLTNMSGPSRGFYEGSNKTLYAVGGSELYIIDVSGSTWSAVQVATGLNGNDIVQMTDNGTTLFILSGMQPYAFNMNTSVLTTLSGGAYAPASSQTFIDGYVVFSQFATKRFYWTDLLTTTASALNFASAEADPDDIVALINNSQDIWVFGRKTIELWYNAGQGNVTFARRQSIVTETGCGAARTIKKIHNTLAWLSADDQGGPMVMIANGYQPQRISTPAIEAEWAKFSAANISASTAYTFQTNGHWFYVLNIPGATSSWVYDLTATNQMGKPMWYEWQSSTASNGVERFRGENHIFYKGFHIQGDFSNGKVYVLDDYYFTDDGLRIMRERTAPHISNEMKRLRYNSLTLQFMTGTTTLQDSDPQIVMQFSEDGGRTWSNEMWHSAGKIGETTLKVQFNRLGMGRDRVFRIRCYDPIYWALSGAAIEFTPGVH